MSEPTKLSTRKQISNHHCLHTLCVLWAFPSVSCAMQMPHPLKMDIVTVGAVYYEGLQLIVILKDSQLSRDLRSLLNLWSIVNHYNKWPRCNFTESRVLIPIFLGSFQMVTSIKPPLYLWNCILDLQKASVVSTLLACSEVKPLTV